MVEFVDAAAAGASRLKGWRDVDKRLFCECGIGGAAERFLGSRGGNRGRGAGVGAEGFGDGFEVAVEEGGR